MAFDAVTFAVTLVGGAVMAALIYLAMARVTKATEATVNEEFERRLRELEREVRLLDEWLHDVKNDVEALKLDVAQLHDALHDELAGDRRSEMEDWD